VQHFCINLRKGRQEVPLPPAPIAALKSIVAAAGRRIYRGADETAHEPYVIGSHRDGLALRRRARRDCADAGPSFPLSAMADDCIRTGVDFDFEGFF
jgi:hypothetical protein